MVDVLAAEEWLESVVRRAIDVSSVRVVKRPWLATTERLRIGRHRWRKQPGTWRLCEICSVYSVCRSCANNFTKTLA
jgi:hypothetical protein